MRVLKVKGRTLSGRLREHSQGKVLCHH